MKSGMLCGEAVFEAIAAGVEKAVILRLHVLLKAKIYSLKN